MFSAIVSLALAASALANVYITSPVASTTFTAGQQATVSWQDNGQSPSLVQFGNATFAIYVGNAIQQTPLQNIATVNVSTTSSIVFTPDGTIGPDSDEYFIRITSLTLMDPTQPQYPAEAFSAKFTLTGMTGSFNASIQAQIDGQSTAPIGPTSSVPSASPSMTAVKTSTVPATTSKATTSTSPSPSSNAAVKPVVTGFVGFVAALIGASFL